MTLLIWATIAALLPLANPSLFASHILNAEQSSVASAWLTDHPEYRLATDRDCACDEDIQTMRAGSGGVWKPFPDYHPYVATGDFNGDGITDFAVVVITKRGVHDFALVVFNGPVDSQRPIAAFIGLQGNLAGAGLFYGPPRPKPYRLVVGRFESEGVVLQPRGKTYRIEK